MTLEVTPAEAIQAPLTWEDFFTDPDIQASITAMEGAVETARASAAALRFDMLTAAHDARKPDLIPAINRMFDQADKADSASKMESSTLAGVNQYGSAMGRTYQTLAREAGRLMEDNPPLMDALMHAQGEFVTLRQKVEGGEDRFITLEQVDGRVTGVLPDTLHAPTLPEGSDSGSMKFFEGHMTSLLNAVGEISVQRTALNDFAKSVTLLKEARAEPESPALAKTAAPALA